MNLDELERVAREADDDDPGRWFTTEALDKNFRLFLSTEVAFFAAFTPRIVLDLIRLARVAGSASHE